MSKRYFPQQYGDRKKAKLDVSISDHNFPLSQNIAGPSKEREANAWGDDQEDMMLLMASQACEEVYNDVGALPDYSICMKPPATSTQLCEPGTSNAISFKKPNGLPSNILSAESKDKCNRISSPLPGISSKIAPNTQTDLINLTDDLIFNDKIFQTQDAEVTYRQLLQLQEENAKLKSENGKLLEKCVTKEGESSILRTQLKSCQQAVDNARLDRIKAQERAQQEWTDKLQEANSKMHDLRTQLDFKNLEIISAKEKVRLLESNKVKLTQVIVPNHDISYSERRHSSISVENSRLAAAAQTEPVRGLALNARHYAEPRPLAAVLSALTQSTAHTMSATLSDSLQRHDAHTLKCRVYSTFHRIPSSIATDKTCATKVCLNDFRKQLTIVSAMGASEQSITYIVNATLSSLRLVESDLQEISSNLTNAFQREMDEKYIDCTHYLHSISHTDLLSGRVIYAEEQAILARRMVAALPYVLRGEVHMYQEVHSALHNVLQVIHSICALLNTASCAIMYSGLLLSMTILLQHLTTTEQQNNRTTTDQQTTVLEIVKNIISSRPMTFVCSQVLEILGKLFALGSGVEQLCPGGAVGNLRLDYEQGVLLYKKDSCYLQVLLKQTEIALKCIEKQALCSLALRVTQNLILLHAYVSKIHKEDSCDCAVMLTQVAMYALRVCADMRARTHSNHSTPHPLLPVCVIGIQWLYQRSLNDPEFNARLGHAEGHFMHFIHCMDRLHHTDTHSSMLTELSNSFQSCPEDGASYSRAPWLNSFQSFAITDC